METTKILTLPEFDNLNITTTIIKNQSNIQEKHETLSFVDTSYCNKEITFAQGKKDRWCVYFYQMTHSYKGKQEICFIPKDTYYFERIAWLSTLTEYGITSNMIFDQFYYIFQLCKNSNTTISSFVLNEIDYIIDTKYKPYDKIANFDFSNFVKEQFLMVYYAMVAEKFYINKKGEPTKFGPLIKILAIYEILIEKEAYNKVAIKYHGINPNIVINKSKKIGLTI